MSINENRGTTLGDFYDIAESLLEIRAQEDPLIITEALGASMQPAILSGDKIAIDPAQNPVLKVGDIIAFSKGSLFVCHRIREIRAREGQKYFITAGDAQKTQDKGEVGIEEIAGKVVFVIRDGERRDPYTGLVLGPSLHFLGKVVRFAKKIGVRCIVVLKHLLKGILECLGIYVVAQQVFFKAIRHRLTWFLALPRKNSAHPAFRFVNVPLAKRPSCEKEFFAPLEIFGEFWVQAHWGKGQIAKLQVRKISVEDPAKTFWAVTHLWVRGMFQESGLEAALVARSRVVLAGLGVHELYSLINNNIPGYAAGPRIGTLAEPEVVNGIPRYLLSPDLSERWGFRYPLVPILRGAFFCLQAFKPYRVVLRFLFRRRIRYETEEQLPEQRAVRFSAYLGKQLVGRVFLGETSNMDGKEYWIWSLWAADWLRGCGIGEGLLCRLLDHAQAQGIRKLQLTVAADKKPARALYKKLGFVETEWDALGQWITAKWCRS